MTMYLHSPLRRRRFRRLLVAAVVVASLGVIAVSYFAVVVPLLRSGTTSEPTVHPTPSSSASPLPGCETAALPGAAGLGAVASINAGTLTVFDLGTCRQSVVVASGAEPPVRFSPDGRWIAFGDGQVVPAAGGVVTQPFGSSVQAWEWSAAGDVLGGVTEEGGVVIASPGGEPQTLLPDGSGVGHLAFATDGSRLAVDRAEAGIQVLDLNTGQALTVFHQPDPARTPQVAGWSPDAQWVLYWRGPVGKEARPLDAVPSGGGAWVNLSDPMLPYRDLISSCGDVMALSVGPGLAMSQDKQILLTGPPEWVFHNLTHDYSRSWFWPDCSADGRWVAAVATPNREESSESTAPRALWVLASDGSARRRVIPGGEDAPEFPRWSRDGQAILVVLRSGTDWSSPGALFLLQIEPSSGQMVSTVGPIADLGSAPGDGGRQGWAAVTDWYQPA
jgi:hypothetical protein